MHPWLRVWIFVLPLVLLFFVSAYAGALDRVENKDWIICTQDDIILPARCLVDAPLFQGNFITSPPGVVAYTDIKTIFLADHNLVIYCHDFRKFHIELATPVLDDKALIKELEKHGFKIEGLSHQE